MAKKSQALIAAEARIAELEARNAALEARLSVAKDVYRNQRAQIAELEAQLNARGAQKVITVKAQPAVPPTPVITRFVRRDGTVCERIRTGNRAVIRPVAQDGVPGIEVSYS